MAYEVNDPAVVRELTMSASLATRNGYRLDWTGTWELEARTPLYALDDPTPLTVQVRFDLPVPVRAERLLMRGLALSRSRVRHLVGDGRIQLPIPLDAKAHRDFELTVHGSVLVDTAAHPDQPGGPTGLSRLGSFGRPQPWPRSAAAGA